MPTARVTTRNQITIPTRVRERLDLQAGDEIEFIEDEHGFRARKQPSGSSFRRYRGHLKHLAGHDPDELVEEMRGP